MSLRETGGIPVSWQSAFFLIISNLLKPKGVEAQTYHFIERDKNNY